MAGALDVAGASPRRYFFEVLRHFATDEREQERLHYLSTPEGRSDLYTYNQREGATGWPCQAPRRAIHHVMHSWDDQCAAAKPWLRSDANRA